MYNHRLILLAAVLFIAAASPAQGQIIYGQPTGVDIRPTYIHWSVDYPDGNETISQLVAPLIGFIPLHDNLEMRFLASGASNTLGTLNGDYTLSGMCDARLQINQALADDRFLWSMGFNLPTGKKSLNKSDELPVSLYLSQNYLSFPVRRLGEGLGANLLIGTAFSTGTTRCGASVMYQFNGPYTAYQGEGKYNPGDKFEIGGSFDNRHNHWLISFSALYSLYSTDKLEGVQIFRSGNELDLQGSVSAIKEKYSITLDARYLLRDRAARFDSLGTKYEQLKIFGNEFASALGLVWRASPDWQISPSVDMRLIAKNESGFDASHIYGFGGNITRNFGRHCDMSLGFKYYKGSAGGGVIKMNGYQISAGLAARI